MLRKRMNKMRRKMASEEDEESEVVVDDSYIAGQRVRKRRVPVSLTGQEESTSLLSKIQAKIQYGQSIIFPKRENFRARLAEKTGTVIPPPKKVPTGGTVQENILRRDHRSLPVDH